MKLSFGYFLFHSGRVIMKEPQEVTKETKDFYYCGQSRFRKDELGIARFLSPTTYPYLQVVMADASEEDIRNVLSHWFEQEASFIKHPFKTSQKFVENSLEELETSTTYPMTR